MPNLLDAMPVEMYGCTCRHACNAERFPNHHAYTRATAHNAHDATAVDATRLWVDVRVNAQQHFHGRANCARCRRNVVQVKLRVDVDKHAFAHRQLELPRELAVAIQDRPAWLREHVCRMPGTST